MFIPMMVALAVMLVGFFWLFELSKWETYLIVLFYLATFYGVHYLLGHNLQTMRSAPPRAPAPARARR